MSPSPSDTVDPTTNEDIVLTAAKPADIQKLSPTNYKVWSDLVIGLLDGRGVGGYTTGTDKPRPTRDMAPEQRYRRKHTQRDPLGGQLGHVMGMQDAKEIWDTLKRIHQRDDSAKVRGLLAEFIRFKLGPMGTIDEAAGRPKKRLFHARDCYVL